MKRQMAFLACLLAFASADAASPTATLLKTRRASSAAATTGVWLANFSKAKSYAQANGVPLVAVWSNGDSCGHCTTFEGACNSTYFKNWMKTSGCVFFFTYPGDSQGGICGTIFHWCRKNKNSSYPFVRIYWPAGGVDIATVGDTVDGGKSKEAGAKKAVAYLSSGAYERLVTDLPYSGTAPSAAEWERFAGSFSSLSGAQTRYAVAYWNGGSWCVAVPLRAPDSDGVETLVLTSGDGSSFNGYRCVAWGRVRAECAKSDYCYWNEEYAGASMLMADGE